jgi:hypothetical protein
MQKNALDSLLIYLFITVLLGFVSFNFIERAQWIKGYKLLTVALVTLLFSLTVYYNNGMAERFPFLLITPEQIQEERARYWALGDKIIPFELKGKPKTVLIGNSHAIDLAFSLHENNYEHDIYYLSTTYHCSMFGYLANVADQTDTCKKFAAANISNRHLSDADRVILHDDWKTLDLGILNTAVNKIKARLKPNAKIYVMGPKMQFYKNVNEIAVDSFETDNLYINTFSKQYQIKQIIDKNKSLIEFSKTNKQYFYIDALTVQCGEKLDCDILTQSGEFIYFDSNHFTLAGARKFGKNLVKLLDTHQ